MLGTWFNDHPYRQRYTVSLSSDKCSPCKSLSIKVSAKCPKCKCKVSMHHFKIKHIYFIDSDQEQGVSLWHPVARSSGFQERPLHDPSEPADAQGKVWARRQCWNATALPPPEWSAFVCWHPRTGLNVVTQVVHDCRGVASSLLAQFGVNLKNVFDTQVMKLAGFDGTKPQCNRECAACVAFSFSLCFNHTQNRVLALTVSALSWPSSIQVDLL